MKISLVVINYNYSSFLTECLQSIKNQTVLPDEVILIDDASTDNSFKIMKAFCKENKRYKCYQNKHNLGVCKTFDKGVENSIGNYIIGLASDDLLLPKFIEKNIEAYNKFPGCGIYSSHFATFFNENPNEVLQPHRSYDPKEIEKLDSQYLLKQMRSKKFWPSSPAMVSREEFMKLGGFDSSTMKYSDLVLYVIVSLQKGLCYIPEVIRLTREHEKQFSRNLTSKQEQKSILGVMKYISKPEFKNLKKQLRRSHIFFHFELNFFYFILKHPLFWSFTDGTLWKKLFRLWKKRKLTPMLSLKKRKDLIHGKN